MRSTLGRFVALGLSVVLCAGTLSGCGSEDQSSNQPNSTTQQGQTTQGTEQSGGTSEQTSAGEPTEISIIIRQLGNDPHPGNEIWEVLDQDLQNIGVKAELEFRPSTDYATQCATVIADGDYPSMMEFWSQSYTTNLDQMVEDGIIRPLDDLIEQYGPNIQRLRTDENSTIYRKDGHIYAIPSRSDDIGYNQCYVIRKDWLDAVGMDVPDSMEELYELAKAFRDHGFSDSPIGTAKLSWFSYPLIELACSEVGIVSNKWNVTDSGDLEYFAVMDEFKEVLAFMRKLYQEGLLEPEYTILDRDEMFDNMTNDKYGICAWYVDHYNKNNPTLATPFYTSHPDTELIVLQPFPDENGVRRTQKQQSTQQVVIFADTSEEEAIACIKFIDYICSDEGGELIDMGIEGVHWERNADGTMSKLVDAANVEGIGYNMYSWFVRRTYLAPDATQESKDVAVFMNSIAVPDPILGITTEAGKEYSSGLSSLTSSSITSMIVDKDIDLDAKFEEYVNTWYSSGGREWTEEINEAYKARQ